MWLSQHDRKQIAKLTMQEWVEFARLLHDMDGRQLTNARRRIAGRVITDYCDTGNAFWVGLCVRYALNLSMRWWQDRLFTLQEIQRHG